MRVKGCRVDIEVTDHSRKLAAQMKANGGSAWLSEEELAGDIEHSLAYVRKGVVWTRKRGERVLAEWGVPDGHVHDDGSIFVPREP